MNYSLSDFEQIRENGFDLTINNKTMEMISFLSLNVGCSNYSKSPINYCGIKVTNNPYY